MVILVISVILNNFGYIGDNGDTCDISAIVDICENLIGYFFWIRNNCDTGDTCDTCDMVTL